MKNDVYTRWHGEHSDEFCAVWHGDHERLQARFQRLTVELQNMTVCWRTFSPGTAANGQFSDILQR